jgi:hypothetical protein
LKVERDALVPDTAWSSWRSRSCWFRRAMCSVSSDICTR